MKTAVSPLAHEIPPTPLDDVVTELSEIYIEKGTPLFMRTVLALFSGGFATFALLYCVQPMMPLLSREFFHQRSPEQPDPVGRHRHARHRLADHRSCL